MRKSATSKANKLKTLFEVLLSLSLLIGVHLYLGKSSYQLSLKKNGGFALWKVLPLELEKEALFSPSDELTTRSDLDPSHLQEILSQKFTFLGRGVQSFAFIGEDGETVLKIFKNYRYHTHETLSDLPLPSWLSKTITQKLQIKRDRRTARAYKFYRSCVLAAYEIPQITHVSYAHVFPTDTLKVNLQLVDKLGITHRVRADRAQFLLQTKLTVADLLVKRQIEENDQSGFEQLLIATEKMMLERYRAGVIVSDFAFHKNVGFLNGEAVLLDFGSILKKDLHSEEERRECIRLAQKEVHDLEILLLKRYPSIQSWTSDFFHQNPSHLEFCNSLEAEIKP